ncbi:hypothetical protein K0M31_009712 [Melipona bicolor]|uniref:Uncharacterized protein n=1 Tax=Melipona bicolor TaxID=60889 RepID=A0AA40KJA8_9HYME|nr:hypothetical protein K0M31_009712 [Melipona bicolor]
MPYRRSCSNDVYTREGNASLEARRGLSKQPNTSRARCLYAISRRTIQLPWHSSKHTGFTFTLPPTRPPAFEKLPGPPTAGLTVILREKERTDERANDTGRSPHDDHDDDNADEDINDDNENDNEYTAESGIRPVRTKAPRNTERRFMELNYGNERHRA